MTTTKNEMFIKTFILHVNWIKHWTKTNEVDHKLFSNVFVECSSVALLVYLNI